MAAAHAERRQNDRVLFPMAIRYRSSSELLGMWREAMMLDVSTGGLRLRTHHPIEPGDRVELHIQLPFRQQLYVLHGRVAWAHETAAGVEHGIAFEVEPDHQVELGELVRFLMQQPPAP